MRPVLYTKLRWFYFTYLIATAYGLSITTHTSGEADTSGLQPSILSKRKITQQDRTFYKFVTRPDIDAPVFDIDVHNKTAVDPGYWFVAPYGELGQDKPGQQWVGPHIYDSKGGLVWSGTPTFGYWNIFDFESRIVHGERMLTLLSDHEKTGFILDTSYEIRKMVPLLRGDEVKSNMHEFNVFDDGKRALFLTHIDGLTPKSASQVVGYDGLCDAKYQGFREVNIDSPRSDQVIFDWDASRHIGLDEVTYRKYDGSIEKQCTKGWDVLHLNSVVKFPDGDYLLSARHTDAVYKISHKDQSVVWRLGGVKSDFEQDGLNFSRQHHVLVHKHNDTHTILTMFDNGIGVGPFEQATSDRSRGLVMLLDTTKMKANIMEEYRQPNGERTNARGSFQILSNGNRFFCWAYNSYMSEHAPDGTLVMEARIPIKLRSYRAFKHPWIGSPSRPPDIHAELSETVSDSAIGDADIMTVVHVSWNGDTRTAKWEFNEIDDKGNVLRLGSTRRLEFETRFEHKAFSRRVFAEAFDADGNSIGKSGVTTILPPPSLKEAGSLTEDDPDVEQGHTPLLHSGEAYNIETSSILQNPVKTFAMGLVCGAIVMAFAMVKRPSICRYNNLMI